MGETNNVRSELELRDYLGVLRRRKVSILVSILVVVGIVAAITLLQTKVYEAKATLVLETPLAAQIINPNASGDLAVTDAEVETEAALMRSVPISRAIQKELGYKPKVKISTKQGEPVVYVRSQDTVPSQAAKEANGFTSTYVKVRQEALGTTVLNAMSDVRTQIEAFDREVATNGNRIIEIEQQIDEGVDPATEGVLRAEQTRLKALVSTPSVLARQNELQTKLDSLETKLTLTRRGDNFTVSGAPDPKVPAEPQPLRNGLIAIGVGLIIGLIVAFLRDYFDDTLRTKEDLDNATGGVPVLALIPVIPSWRDTSETVLESVTHPHSIAAEAYRTLRTSLDFAAVGRRIRIIQVTSSDSGEGKTTTSCNLAVTLANAGKRVVLVDCDLRRPRVHAFFDLENNDGFSSVLLGTADVADALQPAASTKGLNILTSGPTPPNPSELLATNSARQMLETLAEVADFVVVDSPPLLPVADSVTVAGYVDATILVATAKSTTRRSLQRSLEMLEQIDAPLEGILFNKVGREATYGYGYGYTYDTKYESKTKGKIDRKQNPMPTEDDEAQKALPGLDEPLSPSV